MSVTVHFHGGPQDGTCCAIDAGAAPFELIAAGALPVNISLRPDVAVMMAPMHVYRLAGAELMPGIAHYLYHGER